MNNFKKIGMSALAASLVSTSAFAGELTASGSASVTMEGWSGSLVNTSRGLSMADSVYLTGSTELDNGMTVSMSFELDAGADTVESFDDHFVSVSSDTLGTVKFSGNGGSTASTAIDATAAGDMWDNFDGASYIGATGVAVAASLGGDNSLFYTSPSFEGIQVTASYRPDGSSCNQVMLQNQQLVLVLITLVLKVYQFIMQLQISKLVLQQQVVSKQL